MQHVFFSHGIRASCSNTLGAMEVAVSVSKVMRSAEGDVRIEHYLFNLWFTWLLVEAWLSSEILEEVSDSHTSLKVVVGKIAVQAVVRSLTRSNWKLSQWQAGRQAGRKWFDR